MFDIRTCDLQKLNSMTKYPSILTYHELDPKDGRLLEEPREWPANPQPFQGDVIGTEKVDGTNARIICYPTSAYPSTASNHYGYLIGSREDLLYAKGDLIGNPVMGIVGAMKNLADDIAIQMPLLGFSRRNVFAVFFFELYGSGIGKAGKQYTDENKLGFRLFDAFWLDAEEACTQIIDGMDRSRIAGWRDAGGQPFLDEDALHETVARWKALLDNTVELTPRIFKMPATALPKTIGETHEFLKKTMPETKVSLGGGEGKPEGLVLRTADRKIIAKARFEDYERTLRKIKAGQVKSGQSQPWPK